MPESLIFIQDGSYLIVDSSHGADLTHLTIFRVISI